mgnify:CR=1 FL=1
MTEATLILADGKIKDVLPGRVEQPGIPFESFGDKVIMPGGIGAHVHINEPGRTEWEGFETATKAAAAGGITTLIEMPLNASPVTTTVEALKLKLDAAKGKLHVNVGFYGGVIPDNIDDLDGRPQDDNSGVYAIGEADIWRNEDGRGMGVFTQLGFADGDNNQIATYVGGGVTWTGPFPQRPQDVAGLAVAHARNGDHFRRLNAGLERAETTLEASYLVTPKPWLTVQPDVQYIIDPGTDSSIDNALILGVRVQVTL